MEERGRVMEPEQIVRDIVEAARGAQSRADIVKRLQERWGVGKSRVYLFMGVARDSEYWTPELEASLPTKKNQLPHYERMAQDWHEVVAEVGVGGGVLDALSRRWGKTFDQTKHYVTNMRRRGMIPPAQDAKRTVYTGTRTPSPSRPVRSDRAAKAKKSNLPAGWERVSEPKPAPRPRGRHSGSSGSLPTSYRLPDPLPEGALRRAKRVALKHVGEESDVMHMLGLEEVVL